MEGVRGYLVVVEMVVGRAFFLSRQSSGRHGGGRARAMAEGKDGGEGGGGRVRRGWGRRRWRRQLIDEKEKGRRPRALFFGSSKVRGMSSSRPGRRRPPPAVRRGVTANAAARAEQKELWRRVPNSFSIVGAPGAGPRLCWEGRWRAWARGRPLGRVAGAARGAVARLPRPEGKEAWPAPETPPSVSLVPMVPPLGTKRWG